MASARGASRRVGIATAWLRKLLRKLFQALMITWHLKKLNSCLLSLNRSTWLTTLRIHLQALGGFLPGGESITG